MIAVWVGLGAMLGAPLRYLSDRALQLRFSARVPIGTLTVNLLASFLLGLLAGAHDVRPEVAALVGTGLCGALSTWSTFAYEVVALRERLIAVAYLGLSLVAGVGLAALGWALA